MKIGEVSLQTNDVRRLAAFYRTILAIPGDCEDEVHQFLMLDETTLTVYNDGTIKNNQNQNISLAFTVEDVDAEYEKLLKLNVTIIEKPQTRPWGARNMHFVDPDGNHIYFRSLPAIIN